MNGEHTAGSACDSDVVSSQKRPIRWKWLVSASLILVICIEVLPMEADLTMVALLRGDVQSCLVAKGLCLTVILVPLLLYISFNGWRGVVAAKGRIAAIGAILVLRLTMDISAIAPHLFPNGQ